MKPRNGGGISNTRHVDRSGCGSVSPGSPPMADGSASVGKSNQNGGYGRIPNFELRAAGSVKRNQNHASATGEATHAVLVGCRLGYRCIAEARNIRIDGQAVEQITFFRQISRHLGAWMETCNSWNSGYLQLR